MPSKFLLGEIRLTPEALAALKLANQSPREFILRHASGDWGDLSDDDRRENEAALRNGYRLLSHYKTATGVRLWIITEHDRSATTLLLPEEY